MKVRVIVFLVSFLTGFTISKKEVYNVRVIVVPMVEKEEKMQEICPICNIVVATYDPRRTVKGGRVGHLQCFQKIPYEKPKPVQLELNIVWEGKQSLTRLPN